MSETEKHMPSEAKRRLKDGTVIHYPFGTERGGYAFSRRGILIDGKATDPKAFALSVPPTEALTEIDPRLLKIAGQHAKKLRESGTLFRALLVKKS